MVRLIACTSVLVVLGFVALSGSAAADGPVEELLEYNSCDIAWLWNNDLECFMESCQGRKCEDGGNRDVIIGGPDGPFDI